MGRQWLNSFEMGEKASAPLDMVMRVIAALDVTIPMAAEAFDLDEYLSEYGR